MRQFLPVRSEPDEYPLVLDEEDKNKLRELDEKISRAKIQKILILREAARRRGLIADRLEDLKSKSGEPFVEKTPRKLRSHHLYRKAEVKRDSPFASIEIAYNCRSMWEEMFLDKEDMHDSCGWVKGNPIQKPYDNIGPLNGSAGYQYFCKICAKQI